MIHHSGKEYLKKKKETVGAEVVKGDLLFPGKGRYDWDNKRVVLLLK